MNFGLTGYKLTENHCLDDFLSFIPHHHPTPAFCLGQGPTFEACICCESLRSSYLNKIRQEGGSGLRKARRLPSVGRREGWLSSQAWVRCCVQIPAPPLALPSINSATVGKLFHLFLPQFPHLEKQGPAYLSHWNVARMNRHKVNTQWMPASVTLGEELLPFCELLFLKYLNSHKNVVFVYISFTW